MDMVIFEKDKEYVLKAFRNGEFDYLEIFSEKIERGFFQYVFGHKIIQELSKGYPTPRKKEEVPLWLYLSADIMLRLHGQHGFAAYPCVLRSGGLRDALGYDVAKKRIDKKTGDMILECKGFNNKNHYPRQTPCDQDFLRKMARDTDTDELEDWYNRDVSRCLKELKAVDEEGIFIGDCSYVFVPDNENYENSCVLLFDEHNHPVSDKNDLSPEQLKKCRYRRCYKMVSLLHTTRTEDFYMYYSIRVVNGKAHEDPILYEMVEEFVKVIGKGVMKILILDRGFTDGPNIGKCKREFGIDVVLPMKKNMDIYKDAWGLSKLEDIKWKEYKQEKEPEAILEEKPEAIRKREASRQKTLAKKKALEKKKIKKKEPKLLKTLITGIKEFRSWQQCPVPLNVVLIRDIYSDGHEERWSLVTTIDFDDPAEIVQLYKKRPVIEERHRQIKLFWDLSSFRSTAFSLVVNQIVFVALTYSLLQLYLLRLGRKELNRMTRPKLIRYLLPGGDHVTIYYQSYFAFLDKYEHQELLLTLKEKARIKILKKTRLLRKELIYNISSPRGP